MLKHILRLTLLAALALVLSLGGHHIQRAIAADSHVLTDRPVSPVVLDGRELFELSATGSFSAKERTQRVEVGLQQFLKSGSRTSAKVTIAPLNSNTTILLNNRHLLTVTESDTTLDLTTDEQAEIWREQLVEALRQARRERRSLYQQQQRLKAFQALGIAALLYIMSWQLDAVLRQRLNADAPENADTSLPERQTHPLLHLSLLAAQALGWLLTLHYIAGLFPQSRQWRYNFIANFTRPVIVLGDRSSSVLDLVLLVGMVSGLWFSVMWLTERFRTQVLSVTGADRGIQDITVIFSRFALLFVGLSLVLQVWGIDIASLAVLLSALSVGLGFGLQNIANNFISGIIISFDRSLKIGDFIQLNDLMGTVERIGTRSTEIRTLDNVAIVVPNSRFLEEALINWNHGNPISRIAIPFNVAYGSDSERVRDALLEVAHSYKPILSQPEPQVWFRGFGDSALDFELLVWIHEPQNQFKYTSDLNYQIYAALARNNIEIPFPQRDLTIKHIKPEALEQTLNALHNQRSSREALE